MAVNITVVRQGADNRSTHVADVEATADGDAAAVIPHGLGLTPEEVALTGLSAAAQLSLWVTTAIDAVNVTLGKTVAVGSGAAGAQVRCIIRAPHTLGR